MNKFVSVIIPTHNRVSYLSECLNSLSKQDYENLEVIVVDDGSTDYTADIISKKFPDVKIIVNEMRFGAAYSRNLGILKSKGDFILFLDSDIEFIRENTITRMVSILEDDEQIGQIGGEIRLPDKRVFGCKIDSTGRTYKSYGECDYVATCNCMQRKDIVYDIGGFDPYFIFMGEDKDFGFRIKMMGCTNIIRQDTGVLHKLASRMKKALEDFHKNRIRFIRKHYGIVGIFFSFMFEFRHLSNPYLTFKAYVNSIEKLQDFNHNFLSKSEMKEFRDWYVKKYID